MPNQTDAIPVTVYAVGNAHLDTQWLWTLKDTIRTHLPKTFNGNFALLEAHPEYVFSFEGAYRYMLIKEYYPEAFERIRGYVAAGRWAPAGGSLDANDVLVPSAESQVRNLLYGNGFFAREFGRRSVDLFLPDCFGFGAALPIIAHHCGIRGFATAKLYCGATRWPFSLGRWEGPDGSSLVAMIDPGGYDSRLGPDLTRLGDEPIAGKLLRLHQQEGHTSYTIFYGVGDDGGAPEAATVANLAARQRNGGSFPVRMAASDQMVRDLTPAQLERLPRYRGELLLRTHGVGCYTAQAAMKKLNRLNEVTAAAAESVAVVADWLGGIAYPKATLTAAWIRFLVHQFHDDLTGTSIPSVYRLSWNNEVVAQNQFAEVLRSGIGAVAAGLDTRVEGQAVVVTNPLAQALEDVVEVAVHFPSGAPAAVRVHDPAGHEVAVQILERRGDILVLAFVARLRSLEFAVFAVSPADQANAIDTGLTVSAEGLENQRYRVRLTPKGDIASIHDKVLGRELLSGHLQVQLLNDHVDAWPAWEMRYEDLASPPRATLHVLGIDHPLYDGPRAGVITIREQGPVRVTLEVERSSYGSRFVQRISLSAGGDVVRIDHAIDWRTHGTLAKLAFPLAATAAQTTYDAGVGVAVRGVNSRESYEVPAQTWVDQTHADGSFGVALFSDCKYGWDKPDTGTLRLSLLHTPEWDISPADLARKAFVWWPEMKSLDFGHHEFSCAIMGHAGDWREGGVVAQAARFNQPLIGVQAGSQTGVLGRSFSFLALGAEHVAVQALKQAEDSDEIIVRLVERAGIHHEAVPLSFVAEVITAREVDGAEQPLGELTVEHGTLRVDMRPWQLRTLAVRLRPPVQAGPHLSATSLALPFTGSALGRRGQAGCGPLSSAGHRIPAEMFPASLVSAGVRFELGSADGNVVVCAGQVIQLPGNGTCLHLLLAAADADVPTELLVDAHAYQLTVQAAMGLIGQWDSRLHGDTWVDDPARIIPAFAKPAPIAWIGSHTLLADGSDAVDEQVYLYRHVLAIPAMARHLTLPSDPRILLFAATRVLSSDGCRWPQRTAAENFAVRVGAV